MSPRERAALGGTEAPVSARFLAAPLPASAARPGTGDAPSWDQLFASISFDQRRQLLELARRQGFLYAHQIPPGGNGKHDSAGSPIPDFLAISPQQLPAFSPPPVALVDQGLDRIQREAVARALSTPDLFLLSSLPGIEKKRVLAEIITQAAQGGGRVLFLAARSAAIDPVLEQIADREVLYPIRCRGTEDPSRLPPLIRAMTFGERLGRLREVIPAVQQNRHAAEERCLRRRSDQDRWPRLGELAHRFQDLKKTRTEMDQRLDGLAREIRREAGEFGFCPAGDGPWIELLRGEEQRWAGALAEMDAAIAKVNKARTEVEEKLRFLEDRKNRLQAVARAWKDRRWWSGLWWRALFSGNVAARLQSLDEEIEKAGALQKNSAEEISRLQTGRAQAEDGFREKRQQLVDEEIGRRQSEWLPRRQAIEKETQEQIEAWMCQARDLDGLSEEIPAPEILESIQAGWLERARIDEENCKFARQWASFFTEAAGSMQARLPGLVNLVAGTWDALAADPHFGDASGQKFDLLIVEEAHRLREKDFIRLARRARRWILAGELSPTAGGNVYFQRLWEHWHYNLRLLPYVWKADRSRLCCRLRRLPSGQEQRLECEGVADFPEIELRILNLPLQPPVLAEVVFPPSMSIAQAKEYIFRELQEVPIQPRGAAGYLCEEADAWVVLTGDCQDASCLTVTLDNGVREILVPAKGTSGGDGFLTCRLEFAKSAGWNCDRVKSWLWNHLHWQDWGRTVFLERS